MKWMNSYLVKSCVYSFAKLPESYMFTRYLLGDVRFGECFSSSMCHLKVKFCTYGSQHLLTWLEDLNKDF